VLIYRKHISPYYFKYHKLVSDLEAIVNSHSVYTRGGEPTLCTITGRIKCGLSLAGRK